MFKQLFNTDKLLSTIPKKIDETEKRIEEGLIAIGRKAAEYAKYSKDYRDISFNLKSSTGFAVHKNGLLIYDEYDGQPEGIEAGQRLADFNAQFHEGYVVTVTAGMFYGVYVEAHGKDVFTGGALIGRKERDKIFKQLTNFRKR